jgi:proteasome assembly chaperone (PAC2) family protein
MDFLRWHFRPELRRPFALVAFEGWGDASGASSTAAEFLIEDGSEPFATFDPELFFNFQMERPVVQIDGGGSRRVQWPGTDCFALLLPEHERDLIVVAGEEPHLRWRTFARGLIELFEDLSVELVVTMGSFIGRVAHTLPVPIIGVTTDPQMLTEYGLTSSDYQGPTGIIGVLHDELRESGMPSVSLWAPVPHYLAANPNPKAALALLSKAAEITGCDFPRQQLAEEAADFQQRVDEAMRQSEDLVEYVKELESEGGRVTMEPDDAEQLISEIEQFLRDPGS